MSTSQTFSTNYLKMVLKQKHLSFRLLITGLQNCKYKINSKNHKCSAFRRMIPDKYHIRGKTWR